MKKGEASSSYPANCPPPDAKPMGGTFYRLTNGKLKVDEVSKPNDWILPYKKNMGACAGKADSCGCHAHSLFSDLDDIIAAGHMSPWVRSKSVGAIEVGPGDGDLVNSPSQQGASHHDWWPSRDIDPSECVIVREKNG